MLRGFAGIVVSCHEPLKVRPAIRTDMSSDSGGREDPCELSIGCANKSDNHILVIRRPTLVLGGRNFANGACTRDLCLGRANVYSLCIRNNSDAVVNAIENAGHAVGARGDMRDAQRVG